MSVAAVLLNCSTMAVDIYVKKEFPATPPFSDPPYVVIEENPRKEVVKKKQGASYVTDPAVERPIVKAPFGWGAWEPRTVMEMLDDTVATYGDCLYMRWKAKKEDAYEDYSWKQFRALARRAAKSFIALGLEPHYGVSIMGFNCPEWIIANVGAILAGGIATGIYSTNGPDACHWVADNSRSQVILVEKPEYLARLMKVRDRLKHCKAFVQWRGTPEEQEGVLGWKAFLKAEKEDGKGTMFVDYEISEGSFLCGKVVVVSACARNGIIAGEGVSDEALQERIDAQRPGHCCTLIYTSGTTGNPKGVMLSHDNITWQSRALVEAIGMHHPQTLVGYLPLSHIAAQLLDLYLPMQTGSNVVFAMPDALKGSLGFTLKEAQPTFFFGVPRVWEKFMDKIRAAGRANVGLKASISAWAKEIGAEGHANLAKGEELPWGWTLADILVFSKVRAALGFERCQGWCTAAAPMLREAHDFFQSLNMPVQEGYGASETTGIVTLSIAPYRGAIPTTGPNLPGVEVKLASMDAKGDGEILARGRNIFMGYLFNEEASKETIEPDGFYHSGDVGRFNEKGYLRITGRLKEILITAGGENIAPILIEDAVKVELGDFVSNVMLIGDKRKFCSMVLTMKSKLSGDGEPLPELDPEAQKALTAIAGVTLNTVEEAAGNEKVKKRIQDGIDKCNANAISRATQVRAWRVLPQDFSLGGGELTPTMKLKRRIVMQKYSKIIDGIYGGPVPE